MSQDVTPPAGDQAMDDNMEFSFEDIMNLHAQEHANAAAAEPREPVTLQFGDPDEDRTAEESDRAPAMLRFAEDERLPARIKVIGVGGGGGNAVSTMVAGDIRGVEFIAANTDRQALDRTHSPNKLQIGSRLTRGRGAGANPEVGRNAAVEDAEKIKAMLEGTEMVFITAGMGGGTGTGAAPVIAKLAREIGSLAVGVVTKPFSFEGVRRMRYAEEGISELRKNVDALIVIPNDRLINLSEKNTRVGEAFKLSDDVLMQAVKGISDVVLVPGRVNVDFADVKTIMASRGRAVMGMGVAKGAGRAVEAAHRAISSPLLEDGSVRGARAVLINITGGRDMGITEIDEVMGVIKGEVDPDANIIFGMVDSEDMSEEIMVTVIATGFDDEGVVKRPKSPTSLKEFIQKEQRPVPERPAVKRRPEAANGTFDLFGKDDLDKPAYLRRAAD